MARVCLGDAVDVMIDLAQAILRKRGKVFRGNLLHILGNGFPNRSLWLDCFEIMGQTF